MDDQAVLVLYDIYRIKMNEKITEMPLELRYLIMESNQWKDQHDG